MRSFTTNIVATEFPSIGFTLNFEQATVIGDNFFDWGEEKWLTYILEILKH